MGGNIIMDKQKVVQKEPTKEQLEYEELTKKMRIITAKLRIAQEGIDISSISQQNLDKIIRTFDDMDKIQRETQQKTSNIQQKANADIQKINQETGKKFSDVQNRYQDLINSLKIDQLPQLQQTEEQPVQVEPVKEEIVKEDIVKEDVRVKTHEEIVNEITDMVLKAMRDSVSQKVDEILKAVDSKAEVTVGGGVKLPQEDIEKLHEDTKQMTIESVIIGSEDRPDDKDIPIITSEMMQKTEDEIAKRRIDKESGIKAEIN